MPAFIPIDNTLIHNTFENRLSTCNGSGSMGNGHIVSQDNGNAPSSRRGGSFLDTSHRWLKALLNNDSATVEDILNNCTEGDRNRLVNGMFRFQEDIQSYLVQGIDLKPYAVCPLTRPWCIAAVVGAHAVMDLLLRSGVDVRQYDENRNNVVHSLIYIAFLNPDLEAQLTKTYCYLKQSVPAERLRELLLAENDCSFRPLELAAQLATFSLFTAIFETEDVYLTHRESHGVYTIEWFDITAYESVGSDSRRSRSPLLSLMLLNSNKLTHPTTDRLFRSNIIQAWVATKIRSNYIFLLIWFTLRMFFLSAFVIFDLAGSWGNLPPDVVPPNKARVRVTEGPTLNGTSAATHNCSSAALSIPPWAQDAIGGYLLVQAFISVIFHVMWIAVYIYKRCKSHMYVQPTGYKRLLLSRDFYVFCQFLLYSGILFGISADYLHRYGNMATHRTLLSFVYMETWVGLIWSVLFFAQMLPWIGHFIIAVQRMVTDLLKFTLVYSVFMAAFSLAFARLISPDAHGNCPEEYSSYELTVYTTIITMLNMVDYRKFTVHDDLGLRTLHVVYTFMVAIMMLNFLIALFSNSVSYVYNNRRVIETVQRLSVTFMMDDFLVKLCPQLVKLAARHYFSREGDRIYLNRVVIHRMCSQES